MTDQRSAPSSQESVASTSVSNEPAGSAAGRSNGMPTASTSSPSIGPTYPDTATSPPSIGAESNESTFWPADSLASRYQARVARKPKRTRGGSGRSSSEPFALYDHDSSSWRTSQTSWRSTQGLPSETFSGTWPRSGMTRNGIVFQLAPLVPFISEIESGSWPTPLVRDARTFAGARRSPNAIGTEPLSAMVAMFPTPGAGDHRDRGNLSNAAIQRRQRLGKQLNLSMVVSLTSGALNPTWVEWLMGFPLGWTDCEHLATRSYRKSSSTSVGASSKRKG